MLFKIELRVINKTLENDEGNEIDYSHQPQTFILFSLFNSNFFFLLFFYFSTYF